MKILQGLLKELESLKIRDIKLYNSEGKSILADYFILSTADSIIQLEAVRSKLLDYTRKHNIGLKNPLEEWQGGWCLLDFGNFIVNIFLEEKRSFYDLDGLLLGAGFSIEEITLLKKSKTKSI